MELSNICFINHYFTNIRLRDLLTGGISHAGVSQLDKHVLARYYDYHCQCITVSITYDIVLPSPHRYQSFYNYSIPQLNLRLN